MSVDDIVNVIVLSLLTLMATVFLIKVSIDQGVHKWAGKVIKRGWRASWTFIHRLLLDYALIERNALDPRPTRSPLMLNRPTRVSEVTMFPLTATGHGQCARAIRHWERQRLYDCAHYRVL